MHVKKILVSIRSKPRSLRMRLLLWYGALRMRLLLWYGALLAVALGLFAVLVLVLTMHAISQNVDGDIQSEARIASLDLRSSLSATSPYWPPELSLNVIDTYGDPGVAVEVLDTQEHIRYSSASNKDAEVPLSANTIRAALAGQISWFTVATGGERVRVEVLPVRAPVLGVRSNTGEASIIGMLVVAKSMDDVDDTFSLLRTLLLLSGLTTLVGALVGGWIIATHVLHPLSEIVATARTIADSTARGTRLGNLSQRVRRPRGGDEMVQVVDTFNEMLASLESATQTQRRFVADASHELRAPLTTIQGNLAFLQRYLDDLPPEERRTMLADAHGETLRLAQLVEELLLLARADASVDGSLASPEEAVRAARSAVSERSFVELDHAVLQLVRQLRRRLVVEGAKLKLEIGHIEPVRVRGDEENLRRITLILLDNAIKYTPTSAAGVGRIIVSLERAGRQAVLRVRDTGIGIGPVDLPHIFERFYRADHARSRQGTGLGLSIAQTVVEQMGGHISAESTPGKGSTFSVWLPLT